MNLVIVESPAKAKTIEKYLGKGYTVRASMGHVVDLPESKLSVDVENDFEPTYDVMKGKAKIIKELKSEMKKADTLILAVDPDREGEAIGWHIARELGITDAIGRDINKSKDLKRIVFHEITEGAIQDAIKNPVKINMDLVNAQQARRVLDRLVGYKLSPLLWKKVRYGLSAGRVQSAAVRIIVDREREREKFKADEYWSLEAYLEEKKSGAPKINYVLQEEEAKVESQSESKSDEKKEIIAVEPKKVPAGIKFELAQIEGKKAKLNDKKDTEKVVKAVDDKEWKILNIEEKEAKRYPSPPFTTSTMQQAAGNRLGFSAKRTMQTAQRLYEAGHITYMRTDSTNLSEIAIGNARKTIEKKFGKEYVPAQGRHYKVRSKVAQEAHEAIRPTHFDVEESGLTSDQKKLYSLIWKKAISSQMAEARVKTSTVDIEIGEYLFRSNGQRILFPGYLKVYTDAFHENIVPALEIGQVLHLNELNGLQHFTKPPARFTEATLIKELEKYGIGRPSTYAPTISTIQDRGYTAKDGRYLYPTDTAMVVIDLLVDNFPNIVDLDFTAEMEDDLDAVARGEKEWRKLMKDFYFPFEKDIKEKEKTIDRGEYTTLGKSDEKCPVCGKAMIIKLGRFGKFLSCTDFPECKGMKSIPGENGAVDPESEEFKTKFEGAPVGEDGKTFVLKTGRFGSFWAHPDYPKVKETQQLLLKEKCPESGHNLVERKGKWGKTFISCSGYPKCKYIKKKTS